METRSSMTGSQQHTRLQLGADPSSLYCVSTLSDTLTFSCSRWEQWYLSLSCDVLHVRSPRPPEHCVVAIVTGTAALVGPGTNRTARSPAAQSHVARPDPHFSRRRRRLSGRVVVTPDPLTYSLLPDPSLVVAHTHPHFCRRSLDPSSVVSPHPSHAIAHPHSHFLSLPQGPSQPLSFPLPFPPLTSFLGGAACGLDH